MINFKRFLGSEKKYIIIILIFFIILSIISWNRWGYFSTLDSSDELLVPYLITQKLVLYKDIYYFYGPIVSYLLALFVYIFGLNLNIIYLLGLLTTLIYVVSLYILSRQVLNSQYSTLVAVLFLVQLAFFHTGALSFIFPYSFNAVFAGLIVIMIVTMLINHYKTPNNTYLYISSLLCLLCLLIKQDFSISALLICTFYTLFHPLKESEFLSLSLFWKSYRKNFKWRPFLVSIFIVATGFFIFYWVYAQYVGVDILLNSMFSNQILHTHLAEFQENEFFHSKLTVHNLLIWLYYAITTGGFFITVIGFIFFVLKFFAKLRKKTYIALLIILFTTILFLDLLLNLNSISLSVISFLMRHIEETYAGINLWIILILLFLIHKFKEIKNQLLIIILFSSMAFSFRMFFCLKMFVYGFYYLPLSLIAFVFCFLELIPSIVFPQNNSDRQLLTKAGIILLITMASFYFIVLWSNYANKTYKIISPYGTYYALDKNDYLKESLLKDISDYLSSKTSKHDKILCYPILNQVYYYTKLLPVNKYYYLMPDVITSEQDKQALYKDIINKKAKYILISNDDYSYYGIGVLGSAKFYPELARLIQANYFLDKTFSIKFENDKEWKVDIYCVK